MKKPMKRTKFTRPQLAEYLGKNVATITRLIATHRFPPPDGEIAFNPYWKAETIRDWQRTRTYQRKDICRTCSEPLSESGQENKYCSSKCRQKAYRDRQKAAA